MRVFVSLGIGALIAIISVSIAGSMTTFSSFLSLMFVVVIVLPIVGGFLYLIKTTSDMDAEDEDPPSTAETLGRATLVAVGLFLGTLLGLFLSRMAGS